ncbi:MAG: hypothetical protein Q9211_001149 [Gyalolechia sp. 1 TL-2023]
MQPSVGGRTKRLIRKILPRKTEPGSIGDDSIPSKDGDTLEATATGSDVKLTEPQDEGSGVLIPSKGQASQTKDAALTENIEGLTERQTVTAEISVTEAVPAPPKGPETELVKSREQLVSSLFDEAYDSLKGDDPERLEYYEWILTLWLLGYPPKSTPQEPPTSEPLGNNIVASDPRGRREQMNKIIGLWLNDTGGDESSDDESREDGGGEDQSNADKSSEGIDNKDKGSKPDIQWANIVRSLRENMQSTAGSGPDMVLLGAAACLCVQSLSSPASSVLPKLLARDSSYDGPEGRDSNEEQQLLKERIIGLYKAILSYQIGVCIQSIHLPGRAFAELRQASSSASGNHSEAGVVDAEKALACFGTEALKHEKPHRKQAKKEALLKDLNAIDTGQSISALIRQKSKTLKPLYEWVCSTPEYVKFDKGDACMLWVSGAGGTGTSMLMLAMIDGITRQRLESSDSTLLSYSFCGIGQRRPENAASVVKSLIYLVLEHQPELVDHLAKKCESTGRKHFSSADDFYALSLVLYSMIQSERFKSTLFVIDGIDECMVEGLDSFLSLITTTIRLSSRVKWMASVCSDKKGVVSTPLEMVVQPHLDLDFENGKVREIFEKYYIPSKVEELAQHGRYEREFRADVVRKLSELSCRNFLWADIACEAIIQDDSWHALDNLDLLPAGLGPLYGHMKGEIEVIRPQDRDFCRKVLLVMAIAIRPLHITELEAVVDSPSNLDLGSLIQKRCFAFLELCDGMVYFRHHSARDFVRQETKSEFPRAHSRVVESCLLSLKKSWRQSAAVSPGVNSTDSVTLTDYATIYWIRHLHDTEGIEEAAVIQFLTKYPLEWLDTLALKGRLSQAWELMWELETVMKERLTTRLSDGNASNAQVLLRLIRETRRLLHLHEFTKSPAEVRAKNSLLFCPRNSTTRDRFLTRKFPELAVAPVMEQTWSRVVHVLRGHFDYVRCCAYSHDGKFLASASDDCSVRICDATTGKVQHAFVDLGAWVYLVAFSSQGFLAAADQKRIRIWDVATGMQLKPSSDGDLYVNNADHVADISFSDDGSMLVAVGDQSIMIWKVPTYSIIVEAETTIEDIRHVRFSSDGTLIGTASEAGVTIWKLDRETENGAENEVGNQAEKEAVHEATNEAAEEPETVVKRRQEKWELSELENFPVQAEEGGERVNGVAFSPDSKYIAAGTGRGTLCIWELGSGKRPNVLRGHTDGVNRVSFSPDGSLLASVSDDKTTRIWRAPWDGEAKRPALILKGHSESVYGLSFSPTRQKHLATCSADTTIRIWEYDRYEAATELEPGVEMNDKTDGQGQPHTRAICFVAVSDDGEFIASASDDGLISLWNGNTGVVKFNLLGHKDLIRSLVFSCDSKSLVSASDDGTVRIWDTAREVEGRVLYGHSDWVRSAVLSRDGRLVVSGSDDKTVRVWDITRSDVGKFRDSETDETAEKKDTDGIRVLRGHTDYVVSVAYSDNGKYVVGGGDDGRVLLWKLEMDQPSASHQDMAMKDSGRDRVFAVVFTPDGSKLIASSYPMIRIWDTKTREVIREIKEDRLFYTLQVHAAFPDCLVTDVGPVPLIELSPSSAQTKATALYPRGLVSYSSDSWFTWKERKIVFLPRSYRPVRGGVLVRAQGYHIVIGCSSGQILFFRFQ